MRLMGSFQTIVSQGVSGLVCWSDSGSSTSEGATLTGAYLPVRSLPLVTNLADSKSSLPGGGHSTALLTDHYELTMLQGALHSGAAQRRTIFEVFARHLPHGRRYGVVAGTGRLLDALERFRFDAADLDFLRASDIVDDVTLRFLESYRFTGNIWGYAEGDCYFPGSPIIVVEGTFAEGQRGRETSADRDGLAADARDGRGGQRPGGLSGRVRDHIEPAGPPAVRGAVGRDQRARVHPGPRQRAARVRDPARDAGPRDHAAGGHVRRAAGGPGRGGAGRDGPGLGADRPRGPSGGGPPGPGAAGRARGQ